MQPLAPEDAVGAATSPFLSKDSGGLLDQSKNMTDRVTRFMYACRQRSECTEPCIKHESRAYHISAIDAFNVNITVVHVESIDRTQGI